MIIIEGIDGTGKTSVVSKLRTLGMNTFFYDYDPFTKDIVNKYKNIDIENAKNGVSDRSFTSEMVYGAVVRGHSRLSMEDFKGLLSFYASIGTELVYLKADLKTLLERRQHDPADLELLHKFYDPLTEKYEQTMAITQLFFPVHEFDTINIPIDGIIETLNNKGIILRGGCIHTKRGEDDKNI